MLRALESEILRKTSAVVVALPANFFTRFAARRFPQGLNFFRRLRRVLPRTKLVLPSGTSVVWSVQMGPENYTLDLYDGWNGFGIKGVVYLFDTLPHQFGLCARLLSGPAWHVRVTSFNDAIESLQASSGVPWYSVDQAVPKEVFSAPPFTERVIAFSAYGRRHPKVHAAAMRFCAARGLYYDYTTHDRSRPSASNEELYRQYAWHLGHSLFTFCWPVEMTNPQRAGSMRPITCRWFEAAAAGTIVLGTPPDNPRFRDLFGEDFVVSIDIAGSEDSILDQLTRAWADRERLFARAAALRKRLGSKLDWSDRVQKIIEIIDSNAIIN